MVITSDQQNIHKYNGLKTHTNIFVSPIDLDNLIYLSGIC